MVDVPLETVGETHETCEAYRAFDHDIEVEFHCNATKSVNMAECQLPHSLLKRLARSRCKLDD